MSFFLNPLSAEFDYLPNVIFGPQTFGVPFSALNPDSQSFLGFPNTLNVYQISPNFPSNSYQSASTIFVETEDDTALCNALFTGVNYTPSSDTQGGFISSFGSFVTLGGSHSSTDSIVSAYFNVSNGGTGDYSQVEVVTISGNAFGGGTITGGVGLHIYPLGFVSGVALDIKAQHSGVAAILVEGGDSTFNDTVHIASLPPASSSAAGTAGQITWDANFIYVCTATNTWKRTVLTTF